MMTLVIEVQRRGFKNLGKPKTRFVVMVVQPNKFIKSHQTVQLQTVNFMASQLYFSEAVKRV